MFSELIPILLIVLGLLIGDQFDRYLQIRQSNRRLRNEERLHGSNAQNTIVIFDRSGLHHWHEHTNKPQRSVRVIQPKRAGVIR